MAEAKGLLQDQFSPYMDYTTGWKRYCYQARMVLDILLPFIYGVIGACTYLLRSEHQFIYKRQFDSRRIQEYYSRILLDLVVGRTTLLFVSEIPNETGKPSRRRTRQSIQKPAARGRLPPRLDR